MDAGWLVGGAGEAALVVVLLASHDGINNFNDNIASKKLPKLSLKLVQVLVLHALALTRVRVSARACSPTRLVRRRTTSDGDRRDAVDVVLRLRGEQSDRARLLGCDPVVVAAVGGARRLQPHARDFFHQAADRRLVLEGAAGAVLRVPARGLDAEAAGGHDRDLEPMMVCLSEELLQTAAV